MATVETDYDEITTEMMICMKEQGYSITLDGKTISFPIGCIMDMWDIQKQDAIERTAELKWYMKYNSAEGMHTFTMCKCGRKSYRRCKCNECIKEELTELKNKFAILGEPVA